MTKYDNRHRDFSLGLMAYKPAGEAIGWLPQPLSIQAAFPYNGLSTLIFTYPKNAPLAEIFYEEKAGFEVALMLYVPERDAWVEPPNARFMALQWEDDVTDDGNVMKFTAPGIAYNLSKQLIFKGKNDDRLNAAEEVAKDAYDNAETDLRSKESALNSNLSLVKEEMRFKGNTYALRIFPTKILVGNKWQSIKANSILFNIDRKQFYWWKASAGNWYRITKSEVVNRATDTYNKAIAVENARAHFTERTRIRDNAIENAKEATKAGRRPMFKTTAGWAMRRHWDEALARGGNRLAGMGRAFNGTYASGPNGAASRRKWKARFDLDLTIGMSLLDLLENLTEMGQVDWQMRRRRLDLLLPGDLKVDMSEKVGLHLGKDLVEAPDKATRHDFANYILVRGEDNLAFGMKNNRSDPATGWGTWEKALSASGAKKVEDAKEVIVKEAELASRRVKIESTRQLIIHPETPWPMYDYLPGHEIRIYGVDGTMQKVQVQQITLVQDDEGLITGALVLGDRFRSGPLNFKRSLSTTLGGYEKTIGGGTVPQLPTPRLSLTGPLVLPPMSLAAGARVAINESDGSSSVIIHMDWSPSGELKFEPLLPSEEPSEFDTDPGEFIPDY